jgi:hypothetical protein
MRVEFCFGDAKDLRNQTAWTLLGVADDSVPNNSRESGGRASENA